MSDEDRHSGSVLSDVVEIVSSTKYMSLLTRATAENDEPTPGYLFQEIEKITFQVPSYSQELAEYLNKRLDKQSPCVKLKVLKIMLHLIQNGHLNFRMYLRRNDGPVKRATMYNGPPDPLTGVASYENVRKLAQELLDLLFDPSCIQQDEALRENAHQMEARSKLQLGGLGSTGSTKGKYDGFGSSPLEKEETIKEKMMDVLDKLMNPVDDTADKIKAAMTSSPGDYEAVPVDVNIATSPEQRFKKSNKTHKVKAHIPGRAGGGWESDDEDVPESQKSPLSSTASVDSLEKIDMGSLEISPAKQMVNEFCSKQEWPVSVIELNKICKEYASMGATDVVEAIKSLLQEQGTDITLLRALLILEWVLRTDLIAPSVFSRILSQPLDRVHKAESIGEAVKMKARKVKLIIEKLQPSER